MHTIHGARHTIADPAAGAASKHETRGVHRRAGALGAAGLAALLSAGVPDATLSSVAAAPEGRDPAVGAASVAATAGSECLIGGSAVAGGCVVTSQQPVLQIPGSGNVYIVDDSSPHQNKTWVSPPSRSVRTAPAAAIPATRCRRKRVCCRAAPTSAPSPPSPIPPGGRHPC